MTGAQALTLLMNRLTRSNTALRAKILLEMNHYQETELEGGEVLPDQLILRDVTVALTANNRRFTLPADFLQELDEDETLWILDDDSEYQPMTKVGFDDAEFTLTDTGELPLKYSIEGLYGYTFPIPTVDRTLKLAYYAAQSDIEDAATTNVWLTYYSDLLIGGTGLIVTSTIIKDPEAAAIFAGMQARGHQRLVNKVAARQEAGRSRRMG